MSAVETLRRKLERAAADLAPEDETREQAAHTAALRGDDSYLVRWLEHRRQLDLADLLETEAPRCLGCGTQLPSTTWEPHGTGCRSYYGAGMRVSYAAWEALVEQFCDEPLFDRWADGMAQFEIPSRSDGTERVR